jgi:alpha-tubulin suppressor-like RCC1 family protein
MRGIGGSRGPRRAARHGRNRVVGSMVAAACVATAVPASAAAGAGTGPPIVAKLSVRAGSTGGGTRVRITGGNFRQVRWVEFGTKRARIVAHPSASVLVAVTPAHAAALVAVRVRTAAGLSAPVAGDRYRFRRPPGQISLADSTFGFFACARNATWTRCWGDADPEGEFGNGTTSDNASPPVKVRGLAPGVRDVSAGLWDACAVTATRAATCWGSEADGRLGNGVSDINGKAPTPVAVHGLGSGVRSIVAGGVDTCAVMTNGVVNCWGSNLYFALGTGGPVAESSTPVTIAGLPSAVSVAVGTEFACALTTVGSVYCWGQANMGQLGGGSGLGTASATPVQVQGLSSGVQSLSAGMNMACAVTGAGAVKCWGSGSLGDGQSFSSDIPVAVKNLQSGQATVAISGSGGGLACATSTAGQVKCWGSDSNGQLGDGTQNDSNVPVQVKGLTHGVNQVSVVGNTACALMRTGQVECWGTWGSQPSGTPTTLRWYE